MKTKLRIYRLADVLEALKAKAKGDDKTMDLFGLMGPSAPKVAPAPPAQPAAPAAADPREAKREELHRLRQEVAVPDRVFMPAGWNPMAHRQKHAEALAKIDRLEEDLGLKTWQRTPNEAQSAMGMPVAKHRQAVAAALKEGKPVPAHVVAAHPGVEQDAGRGDAAPLDVKKLKTYPPGTTLRLPDGQRAFYRDSEGQWRDDDGIKRSTAHIAHMAGVWDYIGTMTVGHDAEGTAAPREPTAEERADGRERLRQSLGDLREKRREEDAAQKKAQADAKEAERKALASKAREDADNHNESVRQAAMRDGGAIAGTQLIDAQGNYHTLPFEQTTLHLLSPSNPNRMTPEEVRAHHAALLADYNKRFAPQPTPPPPTHAPDDPTHGGRLHQERRIDKHGREQARWVTAPGFDPQVHLAQHADDVARMKWHQVADAFEAVDSHEQVHALAAHILKHRPDLESDVDQAIGETVERLARDSAATEPPAGDPPEPEVIEEAPPAPEPAPPSAPPDPVAPAPKKPPAERAPRAPDPDKIESVGEHVARARRDVAQERMANRDIASMTEAERLKFITKANLIPEVTREQAEAMGKTPGWYEMRKAVVNAIGPSFEGGDDVARKYGYSSAAAEYARMIDHVCKTLDACKSANDVIDAVNEMAQYVKGKSRLPGVYTNGAEAARASSEAWAQAGIYSPGADWEFVSDVGLRGAYHQPRYYAFGPAAERDAGRRMFPVATLGVKFAALMGPEHKRGPGWKAAKTRADRLDREGWTEKPKPASKAEAASTEDEKPKQWRQSVSELPERHGGRPVEKPDPVKFAQDFGLAEVDFGNYLNQDDRRDRLQRAHEAMFDLADAIGFDPANLSLGSLSKRSSGDTQPLSIAFGARGRNGRFNAHYEPFSVDVKGRPAPIINLTKFQGGGTLAHEWGHFLDNMLARAHRPEGEPFAFDRYASKGHTGTLPPDVADAIDGVMGAIRGPVHTHNQRVRSLELAHRVATSSKDFEAVRRIGAELRDAHKAEAQARPSTFYKHAFALDGHKNPEKAGYWATPHEMFARAFEAYVQDKIEDGGRRSSYLVDGTRVTYTTGKTVGKPEPDASHPAVVAARAAKQDAEERHRQLVQGWYDIQKKHRVAAEEEMYRREREGKRVSQWGLSEAKLREVQEKASAEWRAHPSHAAWRQARADLESASRVLEATEVRHQAITNHAQPYPQGEERKAINAAFDRFFETLRAHPEVYKAVLAHMARPIPPGARLQVLRLRGAGR